MRVESENINSAYVNLYNYKIKNLYSMKFILASFIICGVIGCSISDSNVEALDDDIRMNISFVDETGNDLLNPNHPDAITEQNTDLYYVVDGEKERVFEGHLDHPKQFYIWHAEEQDIYYMTLFPNREFTNNMSTTFIEFADSAMDTIQVEVEKENVWVCTKVWYNQELKWKIEDDKPRLLSIIKNGNY